MQKGLPREAGQTLIFIILALVAAAFVATMFYVGKQTPTPPAQEIGSTPSPTPSPSPVDASPAPTGAGETANWKQSNEILSLEKLSFKISNDWFYLKKTNLETYTDVYSINPKPTPHDSDAIPVFTIIKYPNITTAQKKELEIVDGYLEVSSESKITVSGYEGMRITGKTSQGPLANTDITIVLLQVGKDVYAMYDYDPKYINQFNQILSTFKFTQ